jgi:hypothetical protein
MSDGEIRAPDEDDTDAADPEHPACALAQIYLPGAVEVKK